MKTVEIKMRTEDKYFVPKKICENMYYRQNIEKGFTSVAPVLDKR